MSTMIGVDGVVGNGEDVVVYCVAEIVDLVTGAIRTGIDLVLGLLGLAPLCIWHQGPWPPPGQVVTLVECRWP